MAGAPGGQCIEWLVRQTAGASSSWCIE
jgi:hypothetical protein